MITLVHLSDIHFSPRDDLSQFDLDQQIRRALLEDLERNPSRLSSYDGVLITGDIAFGGKLEEYRRAQAWLDELFIRTGVRAASTYVVPGNHDIDRDYVEPGLPLWDSHARLRETADPVIWNDLIAKHLQRDPLHSMLAPLKAYNDFAQGYGCRTQPDQLAWTRSFDKCFGGGRQLRLHGLNSALISDQGDAPGKLLISQFQTSHFVHTSGVVDVVLCHHPPEWLMDKATTRDALRAFAPLVLLGHEHTARVGSDIKQVQLFAGAVQPSRRDPGDWLPTYHIVQLSAADGDHQSELIVRVGTQEFDKQHYRFRPRLNEHDERIDEHRITIPALKSAPVETKISVAAVGTTREQAVVVESVAAPDPPMPTSREIAQRELLVQFFRLGTPGRYAAANEAGLLRDGDDTLPPQTMWAEVFRRAVEEPEGLSKFWTAVAARNPALQGLPNPFAG